MAPSLGNQVQFRFVASDISPGSTVEAGVDDFELLGYAMPGDVSAPTVALGYPAGGETLPAGAPVTVAWTHADDIGVVEARLWLSTDPGTRAQRFYARAGWLSRGLQDNGELRFEREAD